MKKPDALLVSQTTNSEFSGNAPQQASTSDALNPKVKSATEITANANDQVYSLLDFSDKQEIEFAQKGLIAAPDELELKDESGKIVWSQKAFNFLDADAPDTANPSLWRNTQLNHIFGLFRVTDGIYQVRGYDISNITFIEGNTGWIVFDPLMTVECAKAAMQLVNDNLGKRPITGIVISHPHVDHYGGIKGIITAEEVESRQVPIIVPEGFHEHAVSENVYAGIAMGRRAGYQYGVVIDPGETGSLALGIGLQQSKGLTSYITPNDEITKTGETRTVDGVTMEFQLTPGTEAPVEMNTWFADKNALWLAENCTGTLHNLYTLRGAQVRDGNAWAEYIMEAITRYGDKAEVVFQSHNWPHWGNEVIGKYLENTAAMYKFINDQTLMYINQGYNSDEISNMIDLPAELEKVWYTRQYYGTVAHDSKAVYQKYMGWYDANPTNLNPLQPTERAVKLVEYLGGADALMEKARVDFDKGEYQWVAEITNALVFADPDNLQARYLCADALEQMGYQSESGTWRCAYLSGAKELRDGTVIDVSKYATISNDLAAAMIPTMMFDQMGILLDSNAAEDLNLKINFNITDDKQYLVTVRSGVLLYQEEASSEEADATLTLTKNDIFSIIAKDEEQQKSIQIDGDKGVIAKLTEHMVTFNPFFNIVEP